MLDLPRYSAAARAAGIHSLCSVLVAAIAAAIVFWVWYVFPYGQLSGGYELFLQVITIDVICGPLLTFILFNPKKSRKELGLDLSLVAAIQIAALCYGMWTVWQARPLYLVHEVDRFKVISAPDVDAEALKALPANLQPRLWAGPQVVGIRMPTNAEEHNTVLFESAAGGRDYSARPEYYIPYGDAAAKEALVRAQPMSAFYEKHPEQQVIADKHAKAIDADPKEWRYVPVMGRQDWVALLNAKGQIDGFLKGDGF